LGVRENPGKPNRLRAKANSQFLKISKVPVNVLILEFKKIKYFLDPVRSKTAAQKVLGFLASIQGPFITESPSYFSSWDKNTFLRFEIINGFWPDSSGQGYD
jgi:hypothetical protein